MFFGTEIPIPPVESAVIFRLSLSCILVTDFNKPCGQAQDRNLELGKQIDPTSAQGPDTPPSIHMIMSLPRQYTKVLIAN